MTARRMAAGLYSVRPAARSAPAAPARRAPGLPLARSVARSVARPKATTVNPPDGPKLLLTVEEAGARLGFGKRMMYALIGSGEIVTLEIGRYRRVPVQALERFVSRRFDAAVAALEAGE